MTTKNKYLFSTILCFLFLTLFTVSASAEEIESITITGVPVIEAGSPISNAVFTVEAPEGCIVENIWTIWDAEEITYVPIEEGNFTLNDVYIPTIKVTLEDGFTFSDSFEVFYAEGIEEGITWYEETADGELTLFCEMQTVAFTPTIFRADITIPEVADGVLATIDEILLYANDTLIPIEELNYSAQWYCTTDDYAEMTGSAFENDKAYQLLITIEAGENYNFNSYMEVYINGESVFPFADPKYMEIFHDYSLLPPLEQVELRGLPQGLAGEALPDSLEVLNEVEYCDIYVSWLNENGDYLYDETFALGQTYYMYIEINLYGDTPISENFTFLIDGVEYTPTVIWTEYNQAYLELEYTITESSDLPESYETTTSFDIDPRMTSVWAIFSIFSLITTF